MVVWSFFSLLLQHSDNSVMDMNRRFGCVVAEEQKLLRYKYAERIAAMVEW